MKNDPLSPQRLREAAETMDAYWQSFGHEYDSDDLRAAADQIDDEPAECD